MSVAFETWLAPCTPTSSSVWCSLSWAGGTKSMGLTFPAHNLGCSLSQEGDLPLWFSPALCCGSGAPGGRGVEDLGPLPHTAPVCRVRVYPGVTGLGWGLIAPLQLVHGVELPHRRGQAEKTRNHHPFLCLHMKALPTLHTVLSTRA